jgi:L-lactate dehydrogenase complex protein LldG
MSAREDILKSVRRNKPEQSPLPLVPEFDKPAMDLVKIFEDNLLKIGGRFKQLTNPDMLKPFIEENYPGLRMIVSNVQGYEGTHKLSSITKAHDLENLDLAVLQGGTAVAENASIWLSGDTLPFRALPVICQHLVLVFNRGDLVYNMHEAYQKIEINRSTYGAFIAGPSKTADIEQSLVIGAHGPKSMIAVMLG